MGAQEDFNHYTGTLSPWNNFVLNSSLECLNLIRAFFANRYLKGEGLEIGALHNPIKFFRKGVKVRYADKYTQEEAARTYQCSIETLVKTDFLVEANDLSILPSESFDFVIANHLLEHLENPLTALEEWLRVIKKDGILFLTLPNFRTNLFDFKRSPTRIDHLIEVDENAENPIFWDQHKIEHWKETISIVEGLKEETPEFSQRLNYFQENNFPIHYHTYDLVTVLELLSCLSQKKGHSVDLVDFFYLDYSYDMIFIIRKNENSLLRSTALSQLKLARNAGLLCSAVFAHRTLRTAKALRIKKNNR